jgi:hypothetical protein
MAMNEPNANAWRQPLAARAKDLRHLDCANSDRIVTQIQSGGSPTDSPVRVRYAQPRSRLKLEVPGHADGQKVLFAVKSMGGESNASLPLRQCHYECPLGSGGCLCRLQPALRATRKGGPIIEAACWAHGRRKFFDLARLQKAPIAIEAVERIDALFAIEHEINGLAPVWRCAASAAGHLSSSWRPGCASNMPSSPGGARPPRRSTTASSAGPRSPASSTTAACACPTTRPSVPCASQ